MARSEPEKYKRAIRFVFDVASPSVIMPTSDLTAAELRRGRVLQGTERFVPRGALAAYKRAALQLDAAANVGAEVGERKDASVRAGKAMREAVWQKLGATRRMRVKLHGSGVRSGKSGRRRGRVTS